MFVRAGNYRMSTKSTKTAKSLKKPKAQHLTLCIKCGGEIFRSTFRNFGEVLMGPILLPVVALNIERTRIAFICIRAPPVMPSISLVIHR